MTFKTEQEKFWAGSFGDEYIERNTLAQLVPARLSLFSNILSHTRDVSSVIEFGANIGGNMFALHQLLPQAKLTAVEINQTAAQTLQSYGWMDKVICESFLENTYKDVADFSFTSGVLIHLNPDYLPKAYENLYLSSRRYVMVCEYYNPSPVIVPYRDHQDRLFKRDFAGEMMDKYPDLKLVSYGFAYRRDPNHPMDDLNWFLMEKR